MQNGGILNSFVKDNALQLFKILFKTKQNQQSDCWLTGLFLFKKRKKQQQEQQTVPEQWRVSPELMFFPSNYNVVMKLEHLQVIDLNSIQLVNA